MDCKGGGKGGRGKGRGGRKGGGWFGSRSSKSGKGGSYDSYNSGGKASTAGFTGSNLGSHLGYNIGIMRTPHVIYSVSHYYHPGHHSIAEDSSIYSDSETTCHDITFCPNNSHPLCLRNGTVYCIAPRAAVSDCVIDSIPLECINTTLTVPCETTSSTECTSGSKFENAQIPCIANVLAPTKSDRVKRNVMEHYCVIVIADPTSDNKGDGIMVYILGATIFLLFVTLICSKLFEKEEEKAEIQL